MAVQYLRKVLPVRQVATRLVTRGGDIADTGVGNAAGAQERTLKRPVP